jgi:hypothetical protein
VAAAASVRHWLRTQELLLQNEYLAAENRILTAKLPSRLRLAIPRERPSPRSESWGRKALREVASIAGKVTNCCSQSLAMHPNQAVTSWRVATGLEACSNSMAVPHE